mmetsp:Transcript_99726/g.257845  ORF Transcript_99726/g.257845 Transcript_99726/m.257845 type:complete len:280 (+) Transcript_99726:204-1043(+)
MHSRATHAHGKCISCDCLAAGACHERCLRHGAGWTLHCGCRPLHHRRRHAVLHLKQGHRQVDLRPDERRVVVGLPLVTNHVVCLAAEPRPELAIVASDCGQRAAQEELLQFEILGFARLLIQLAVETAYHGVEQAPLRLLAWLQEGISCLQLLVREVLGRVITDLVLVVLAPIAVLPVPAHADVAHQDVHLVNDLQTHLVADNPQRVTQEDASAVCVPEVALGLDDLVGQDLPESQREPDLQHLESVRPARGKVPLPGHELGEGPRCCQARADGGGVLR